MLNEKGETLEEFLKNYNPDDWTHPSYTVDAILLAEKDGKANILLVNRANHPYIGEWAFPGGFVNEGESAEEAIMRELKEETDLQGIELEQLYTVSTPKRDPRGWTVTTCFFGAISADLPIIAGDDAASAEWFAINYVSVGDVYRLTLESENFSAFAELNLIRNSYGKIDINKTTILAADGIAFDHAKLIILALESL